MVVLEIIMVLVGIGAVFLSFRISGNNNSAPAGGGITKEELEEERRLFYVAVTRAKQRLFISYLKKRYDKTLQPSRFIGELNNLL